MHVRATASERGVVVPARELAEAREEILHRLESGARARSVGKLLRAQAVHKRRDDGRLQLALGDAEALLQQRACDERDTKRAQADEHDRQIDHGEQHGGLARQLPTRRDARLDGAQSVAVLLEHVPQRHRRVARRIEYDLVELAHACRSNDSGERAELERVERRPLEASLAGHVLRPIEALRRVELLAEPQLESRDEAPSRASAAARHVRRAAAGLGRKRPRDLPRDPPP